MKYYTDETPIEYFIFIATRSKIFLVPVVGLIMLIESLQKIYTLC